MSKSLQLIPQEGEDPEASFRALGKNFDLDPQVVQLLLKSHLKNFEEFRFFFSDEASVESFLAKIDLKDHQKVQVARLRRAWAALKAYYTQFEGDKSRVPESDLDTMLGRASSAMPRRSSGSGTSCGFPRKSIRRTALSAG